MSIRQARLTLWIALVVMLPLPLFWLEIGIFPTARALLLGGVCLAVVVLESSNGMVGMLAILFLGQAIVQGGLLWGIAHLVARALASASPRLRLGVVTGIVLSGLVLAASNEPYRTPYRAESASASLMEIFE